MGVFSTTWRAIVTRCLSVWRSARVAGKTGDAAKTAPALTRLTARIRVDDRVSVVIPALNEAKRIAEVVQYARSDPATNEVIVIDDSSIDDTAVLAARAGARVITSSMLGKGRSMRDGLIAAQQELIVYLDGDLSGLRPGIISDLALPLARDEADFVKASFGRGGGRVTELTAKPMLKLFFPELGQFTQPLGGIIAARKSLLQTLSFEDGYGVDVGLLIDTHRAGARIAQVEIGGLAHESQSLKSLSLMAQEVGRVIFERAKAAGRLTVEQILSIYELERQNQADVDCVVEKLKSHKNVVLLPLDHVVTRGAYLHELAQLTGRADKLAALEAMAEPDMATRAKALAQLFRFVHKHEFEAAAHALVIRPQVIETVNQLRRSGYAVCVISEDYFVAAEIIRRRIFADVALANTIQFEGDVCQGEVRINRAFLPPADRSNDGCALSYAMRYFRDLGREHALQNILVVGEPRDAALMHEADFAFSLSPMPETDKRASGVIELTSFAELLTYTATLDAQHRIEVIAR